MWFCIITIHVSPIRIYSILLSIVKFFIGMSHVRLVLAIKFLEIAYNRCYIGFHKLKNTCNTYNITVDTIITDSISDFGLIIIN